MGTRGCHRWRKNVSPCIASGGTALGLQIGHRQSVDFDFYNEKEFNANNLVSEIKKFSKSLEIEIPDTYSVMGQVNGG